MPKSREYDAGKAAFGKAHAVKGAKQVVRHIVPNDLLRRNCCDKTVYNAAVAHNAVRNYQMGTVRQNNSMDKLVDNGVAGAVFGTFKAHKHGYNAAYVARAGVPVEQQLGLLRQKAATARAMYAASSDHVTYKVMAHEYHKAAQSAIISAGRWPH